MYSTEFQIELVSWIDLHSIVLHTLLRRKWWGHQNSKINQIALHHPNHPNRILIRSKILVLNYIGSFSI